jgi:hypothetical protein
MTKATNHAAELYSIGHAAVLLTQMPGTLLRVLGEAPALMIDGVPHIDATQIERLRAHFQHKLQAGWSNDPQLRRRRL